MTPLQAANIDLIGKKFSGYAKQVEKEASILFKRPVCDYYTDIPYYDYFPPAPKNFVVNFNLTLKD